MRRDGARFRRHPRLRPLALRGGLRRGRPGRRSVRLPWFRRLHRVATPTGIALAPTPGLPCGIAAARKMSRVDPERIVLWGTSYSGGHVVTVAARDGRVAAAISMTPAM